MGAELHRLFHNAPGNCPAQAGRDIVRGKTGDYLILDMRQKRCVNIKQRACVHGQVADT